MGINEVHRNLSWCAYLEDNGTANKQKREDGAIDLTK